MMEDVLYSIYNTILDDSLPCKLVRSRGVQSYPVAIKMFEYKEN